LCIAEAQAAAIDSESAFFDPSMLALLYFPDEHKYAIYMPLFLPVYVTVLAALFRLIAETRRHAKSLDADDKKEQ
jgi:phosphatidylinositol glycan class S